MVFHFTDDGADGGALTDEEVFGRAAADQKASIVCAKTRYNSVKQPPTFIRTKT